MNAIRVSQVKREYEHEITKALAPIVIGMCRHPEDCRVDESYNGGQYPSLLRITVMPHTADFRVICGTKGRQIKALRYLINRAGAIHGLDADIALEESFLGEKESRGEFVQNPEFDVAGFQRMFADLLNLFLEHRAVAEYHRNNDKLIVLVTSDPADVDAIAALGDVLYPWGFCNGMIIDVKLPKERAVR